MHCLGALLVAGANWSHDDHVMLLRSICDSVDVAQFMMQLDHMDTHQLETSFGM